MKFFWQTIALITLTIGEIYGIISHDWLFSTWIIIMGLANYIIWADI